MKKRIISLIIAAVMLAVMIPSAAISASTDLPLTYVDGKTYYVLDSADDMFAFAALVNGGKTGANAWLLSDIDLAGREWTPIGSSSNKYSGIFDGQGHSITGFSMTVNKSGYWGLIGFADTAEIKNFSISGEVTTALTSATDTWYGVVGQADGETKVTNVHSSVNYTLNDEYKKKFVGGIVGQAGTLTIDRCSFSGAIDLGENEVDRVGGILAYAYNGKKVSVTNCGFYGSISSSYSAARVGGIVGYYNGENGKNLNVSNCLNIGTLPEGSQAMVGALNNYGSTSAGSNNYYLVGITSSIANVNAENVSEDNLKEGRLTFMLGEAWGLELGVDEYPTIGGMRVYKAVHEDSEYTEYTNVEYENGIMGHTYASDRYCACGAYLENVTYLEASWDEEKKEVVYEEKICEEFEVVTESTTMFKEDSWYVAHGEVTVSQTINFLNNANLILLDGAILKTDKGIYAYKANNSISVYAQSTDESRMGSLVSTTTKTGIAVLGGSKSQVTLHGGNITATSPIGAVAAIGAESGLGNGAGTATVVIYGGVIKATGKMAIGGAANTFGETAHADVIIYGGDIYADGTVGGYGTAGTVTVNGGIVRAKSFNYESGGLKVNRGVVYSYGTLSYVSGVTYTLPEDHTLSSHTLTINDTAKVIVPSGVTLINNTIINGISRIVVEEGGSFICNHKFFENGACKSCGARLLGDVSGDGLVTNADVLAIYRYIYNAELYPLDVTVGDVNGDGYVTNADVLAIFRYIYNPELYPLGSE